MEGEPEMSMGNNSGVNTLSPTCFCSRFKEYSWCAQCPLPCVRGRVAQPAESQLGIPREPTIRPDFEFISGFFSGKEGGGIDSGVVLAEGDPRAAAAAAAEGRALVFNCGVGGGGAGFNNVRCTALVHKDRQNTWMGLVSVSFF